MLRFVPVGAVAEVDGGRPTSRGLPPTAFWGTGIGGERADSPKRDSQGMDPLSGCGQSPPVSLRDGRRNRACGRDGTLAFAGTKNCKTSRRLPRPPARLSAVPDGQSVRNSLLSPATNQDQARDSEALLPRRGKQRRPAHRQHPLPPRGKAASPNASLCRRQAPAPEPAAVYSHCRLNRNETQRARPLLVGRARVIPEAEGAGRRHCRPFIHAHFPLK